MYYIIIEVIEGPEYAVICTDEEGNNIIFDSLSCAEAFAENECKKGLVVEVCEE